MSTPLETVGVIGLGTMGAGIVEVFAKNGKHVVALDTAQAAVDKGRQHLEKSTAKAVARGKLSEQDQQNILDRISYHTDMAGLAQCQLVIEAVPEVLAIKKEVFAAVEKVVGPETILATNTSSLSVTDIAVATGRPDKVIGMHFFNPAPILKLVEVITTLATSPDVIDTTHQLALDLGKTPIVIGDKAGFVGNAMLFGYLNHAIGMFADNFATREDIDAAMRAGAGYPMGPLTLLDLIGLDTSLQILNTIHAESHNSRYAPHPLLRQMVKTGRLGRKTGRGFYTYEAGKVVADNLTPAPATTHQSSQRVVIVSDDPTTWNNHLAATDAHITTVPFDEVPSNADLANAHIVLCDAGQSKLINHEQIAVLAKAAHNATVIAVATTHQIAALAGATHCPEKIVGLHTGDLIDNSTLVEVSTTAATTTGAVTCLRDLLASAELTPAVCKDRTGRIVEALLLPYLNESIALVDHGYATADEVDTAMTKGCGYPEGPFVALDRIGLDRVLVGQEQLLAHHQDPAYQPAHLLNELVALGHLGRTTGQGFRSHTEGNDAASQSA